MSSGEYKTYLSSIDLTMNEHSRGGCILLGIYAVPLHILSKHANQQLYSYKCSLSAVKSPGCT